MRYRGPMPPGPVMEGVYVDDHVCVGIVPKGSEADPAAAGDHDRLIRGRSAYAAAGLLIAVEKSVELATKFHRLGH